MAKPFLCCGNCQKKGSEFDDLLLKPDVDGYSFDRYFDIDSFTGEITPNPVASRQDQQRAKYTIDLYGFNHFGRPEDRQAELNDFEDMNAPDINKRSYRFYLQRQTLGNQGLCVF